jgi:alpha-glucoside transport system substrate-binding protein
MRFRRATALITLATAATLVAAGCSSSKSNNSGTPGTTSSSSGGVDGSQQPATKIKPATLSGDCAPFGKYGSYPAGTTVTMYASITDPEGGFLKDSWKQFEKCTGITISYTGDKEFETAIKTKVEGGNAPDIAIFPQPGLVKTYAEAGKLKPASQAVFAETKANWNADWVSYGSPDGVFFAAPMGANAKSLVWYSPKAFKKAGYVVPTTWDEMIALSDKIVASGQKPWCAGIESGTATGWVATDWMEEVMLRMYGPDVYDQWVQHKIPFNDQKVQDVIAKVGTILKNPKYVNAGIGDVKSIATTAFAKAGLPIEKGKCWMHQQASFYGANWDKGYTVAPDGDLFAFYEPTISDKFGKPVEGGGEFVGAFTDKAEVEATQLYLASAEWGSSRAKVHPGWVSANKNVNPSVFTDPVDALSVKLLTDPQATFRFDGSDAMPSSVGAGTFWTQMTAWIQGQSDKATLDAIEKSWPQ